MTCVKRKRRSDRNHVIYMIENQVTGHLYVGITVMSYRGSAQKTLDRRVQKHVQRAFAENKSWALCESFRKYQPENHVYWVHDVVRGKAQAHQVEVALIDELDPQLNTFKKFK
jgi:Uri superfamily endonuclease